jgi:hypothetical protein
LAGIYAAILIQVRRWNYPSVLCYTPLICTFI